MDGTPVIAKIEKIIDGILDSVKEGCPLNIALAGRQLSFPGKTPDEAWRFTAVVRILGLMHEALREGVICTKRDIFYKDPALFHTQRIVDDYVDKIAKTLGVSRPLLNVVGSSKGLAAGAFTMHRANGTYVCGADDREGFLIPTLQGTETFDLSAVRWILVVEKDATFHALTTSRFWSALSTQGILITAKGYPDLATRQLLHRLSITSPLSKLGSVREVQVYGLFDYDPDGMAIYSIYQLGSARLAHEAQSLVCPPLQLLGVSSEDVYNGDGNDERSRQGLLPLSQRDRQRAVSMLMWRGGVDAYDLGWHRELQVMLVVGMKAEMQILDSRDGGLVGWLEQRILV